MPLPTNLPAAILATILNRLARLFLTGANGDLPTARHAASQMLAAYHPQTEDELSLAAEIISFAFHALDALSQAADPDLSLNQKLRLRGSAVSLSRESHKSHRKLDQLQKTRRAGISTGPQPEPVLPEIDPAPQLIETTTEAPPAAGKIKHQTWTQGYQQRQLARRIADKLQKANATLQAEATNTPRQTLLAG